MKRFRPVFWTYIGLACAAFTAYDVGAGKPLSAWWWAGFVVALAWPFVVRLEYSGRKQS